MPEKNDDELAEEVLAETDAGMDIDVRAPLNTKGRAPHEPPIRERKKRGRKPKATAQQDAPAPDQRDLSNPRLASDPDQPDYYMAQQHRKRQKIWDGRKKRGMQVRRKIYDKDGNETGASTSSLR